MCYVMTVGASRPVNFCNCEMSSAMSSKGFNTFCRKQRNQQKMNKTSKRYFTRTIKRVAKTHIAVTRLSGHAALMCEDHTNCFPFLCFVVANLSLPEMMRSA